jgi:hypothetical protein
MFQVTEDKDKKKKATDEKPRSFGEEMRRRNEVILEQWGMMHNLCYSLYSFMHKITDITQLKIIDQAYRSGHFSPVFISKRPVMHICTTWKTQFVIILQN